MERSLSRVLVAWVDFARRRARAVLVSFALATVAFAAYAALTLGVNTHHTAILDDDMPFWRAYNEFAEVFPILDEALLVVIDADTVEDAQAAANALAERLAQEPERYRDIYVPGGDPFFQRSALLYLDTEELEELSDQLATVQPLLAQIVEDGSLARVARVLEDGVAYARTDPTAEGLWLGDSADPDIASGRDFFEVDVAALKAAFAALEHTCTFELWKISQRKNRKW